MSFKEELRKTIKNRFLAGLLVIVPLFIAIAILKFAIEAIDNFISPYIYKIIGEDMRFPFIGLAVTIMLVMLAGIFTSNFIGRKIYGKWENFLLRIPLFSTIYSAAKQLIEGVTVPNKRTFENVVLVEYPRKGIFVLGFLANRITIHDGSGEKEFWSVFLPSSPAPFTGIAVLIPAGEGKILDMTVEQGIRFFVSGSVSAPERIRLIRDDKRVSESPKAITS